MFKVIDAHALMVFLEKEKGFEKIEQFLADAAEKEKYLLMTSVNFGEVYYIVLRECGIEKAREVERIIKAMPINIVSVDVQLARAAASFKAKHKISYADCFAAGLAKLYKVEVITGDKEFKPLEDEIKVIWI